MIINWKDSGPWVIDAGNQGGPKIGLTNTYRVLPGCNEIPDEDWEKIKKISIVQTFLSAGLIEEFGTRQQEVIKTPEGESKVEVVKPKAFKDLSPEEALKIVADTWDSEQLVKWRKSENRDELRAAIANQIEKIEKGSVNPDEKQD